MTSKVFKGKIEINHLGLIFIPQNMGKMQNIVPRHNAMKICKPWHEMVCGKFQAPVSLSLMKHPPAKDWIDF
jgi:hypothetical protein